MWYDDLGAGEALLLLNPGGADARAWAATAPTLGDHFYVFTPERRGHGRTPDAGPITYELMAQDTISFIEQVVGRPAHVVGWSAGAVVALLVALAREDLVRRLVLISGVHHRDGWCRRRSTQTPSRPRRSGAATSSCHPMAPSTIRSSTRSSPA